MSERQVYGFHSVTVRLRTAQQSLKHVYIERKRFDPRMQRLIRALEDSKVPLTKVDSERLRALCGHGRHQGVVAQIIETNDRANLAEILDTVNNPLLLALDGVTDPHNLGAILRSADAAGAHAVVAPKDRAVGITDVVSNVSCGADATVNYLMVTNLARELASIRQHNCWVIGLADDAPRSLYDCDLRSGCAFVLGAEGAGMRRLVRERCDELVSIPMTGAVESLNGSVAAALCMFETLRQRRSG